jgi:hypothetical protein
MCTRHTINANPSEERRRARRLSSRSITASSPLERNASVPRGGASPFICQRTIRGATSAGVTRADGIPGIPSATGTEVSAASNLSLSKCAQTTPPKICPSGGVGGDAGPAIVALFNDMRLWGRIKGLQPALQLRRPRCITTNGPGK